MYDFQSLPIGLLPTEAHTVGTSPVNKAKNRFANITACEFTLYLSSFFDRIL